MTIVNREQYFARLPQGEDSCAEHWRGARAKLERALEENADFARMWNAPLDDGEIVDDIVDRAREGEFGDEVFNRHYAKPANKLR